MSDDRQTIDENRKKCICGPCPTYNECMRANTELIFCLTGKSPTCTFEKKGCLCPDVPGHDDPRPEESLLLYPGTMNRNRNNALHSVLPGAESRENAHLFLPDGLTG